jgi:adenosylhomocysteine nucleosidase
MGNRANGGIPTSQDSLCSVIAITGLALEARIVRGKAIIIDPLRAPEIVLGTIPSDVAGILSFGVCGGLAPDLIPGQCIVGSSVIYGDQYFQTDKEWSNRLVAALPGAKYARIAGVDSPIAEPQERKRFYDHTEAVVCDMESHVAARIASLHDMPFAVCRVVLNSASRRLPPAALLHLQRGFPDFFAILRSVVEQPFQIKDLLRLMIDASAAVSALRRVRHVAGADFAYSQPNRAPV